MKRKQKRCYRAVTPQLICTFVLADAKSRFSHDTAHFLFHFKRFYHCVNFTFHTERKLLVWKCNTMAVRYIKLILQYITSGIFLNSQYTKGCG